MVRRDKSGSEAETGRKRRRNRYGLHTGSSGSTRERDWVVGSQILTASTGASDQRQSTRYGVKMDSSRPCRKTQRQRGEESLEVILVLRNTSTGYRLLNTTEAEQGRWE